MNQRITPLSLLPSDSPVLPGKPLNNAVAESFFACMKREELSHNLYKTKKELEADVAGHIDYSNSRRKHQKLSQRTPIEVEEDFSRRNELLFQYRRLTLADWIELKKVKRKTVY